MKNILAYNKENVKECINGKKLTKDETLKLAQCIAEVASQANRILSNYTGVYFSELSRAEKNVLCIVLDLESYSDLEKWMEARSN